MQIDTSLKKINGLGFFAAVCMAATFCLQVSSANAQMPIVGNFESGRFGPSTGVADAFWVRTLPENQTGAQHVSTGDGGGGPQSGWDLKVVGSLSDGNGVVAPRRGNYFARFLIDRTKNYTGLNDGADRPRAELHALHDRMNFDFDTEVWLGVSIYVPENFEDEMLNNHLGGIVLISTNTDSAASFMSLRIHVPEGESETHWVVKTHTDDQSVTDSLESRTFTDLGPIAGDKGKWTDFVIRMRANPFEVRTNPAAQGIPNAFNESYGGNKGIMQVWKSVGSADSNGDRPMQLKMNILNAPVGLVPGTTQGKSQLHTSMRTYKAHWQTMDTTVFDPIWIGFDEFRLGQAARDSVGYSDVHPSGQPCSTSCPGGSSAADWPAPPKQPTLIDISD